MEKVIILPENSTYRSENALQVRLAHRGQHWRNLVGISAGLGVLSGLFGLIFSATDFLGLPDVPGQFGHLGTWLLIAFFTLMMLAAHALDKAGEVKKKLRRIRLENKNFQAEGR